MLKLNDKDIYIIKHFINEKSKILFLYSHDIESLAKVQNISNNNIDVFEYNIKDIEFMYQNNINVINGNINIDLVNLKPKSYDFIIVNNVITKSRFPLDFLKNVCKASKNVILISNNIAHYSYRLKFFFYGSLFVKNNFDIPNITIEEPWYDQSPWRFSVKDIVNLCSNGGLRVAKGFYFDSSEDKILNIYDMRNYPNLYAKKVFYLITNESFETTIPFSLSLKGI